MKKYKKTVAVFYALAICCAILGSGVTSCRVGKGPGPKVDTTSTTGGGVNRPDTGSTCIMPSVYKSIPSRGWMRNDERRYFSLDPMEPTVEQPSDDNGGIVTYELGDCHVDSVD